MQEYRKSKEENSDYSSALSDTMWSMLGYDMSKESRVPPAGSQAQQQAYPSAAAAEKQPFNSQSEQEDEDEGPHKETYSDAVANMLGYNTNQAQESTAGAKPPMQGAGQNLVQQPTMNTGERITNAPMSETNEKPLPAVQADERQGPVEMPASSPTKVPSPETSSMNSFSSLRQRLSFKHRKDADSGSSGGKSESKPKYGSKGEQEKEEIKEKMKESQEPKRNAFKEKGRREVEDPVTGGTVIIQDNKPMELDPMLLDSRYGSGYSELKPVEKEKYDMKNLAPEPARPTSLLLQRFPEPLHPELRSDLGQLFGRIYVGYAVVAILVWGVAVTGASFLAVLCRTGMLLLVGFIGFLGIGRAREMLLDHFERMRASMERQRGENFEPPYPESVQWLNAAIATIWRQLKPDLFTAMIDQVEDIMQASLPGVIQAVKISDFGMGDNPARLVSMRGLADLMTDADYPRKTWIEKSDTDNQDTESGAEAKAVENMESNDELQESIKNDNAGDFLNMEVSFCYAALPGKSGMTRARNVHLLVEFFLGFWDWVEIPLPVWVQIERMMGTVRIRAQITSAPPFVRNVTFSLMGVPNLKISAIPMSRMLPNVLDLPIISQFVQSSIAAATNMYVAPKSMTLNVSQILNGDGVKKDTDSLGVLVVNIHHGEGLSSQDTNGKSDPYCVLSFAKFGRPMYSTRIVFEDLNPVWEETAFLLVSREDLRAKESLSLQLWDWDRTSADDIVGRVNKTLSELTRKPNQLQTFKSDLMGFEDADMMEGQFTWSVGFFEKVKLDKKNQRKQEEQGASSAEKEIVRKPSPIDSEQEALALDTPPSPEWPSGVMSVIIKYVSGLERRDVEKGVPGREKEGSHGQDVEMSANTLPSGYCELILNDNLFYESRVKPYNNLPYFDAGTEIFVRDWTQSELRIIVRDSRVREHDPMMGIVALPLKDLFAESSQVEQEFSLQDGVGYGKVACSIVYRSVKLSLPRELRGFNTVTVELLSNIELSSASPEWSDKLKRMRLSVHANLFQTRLASLQKQTHKENEPLLCVPVYDRYSTQVVFLFGGVPIPGVHRESAIAVLPLRELEDNQLTDVELPVLVGPHMHALERNYINKQTKKTHEFTEVGMLSVRLRVAPGLSEAFRPIANGKRDRHEFEVYERLVGLPQQAEINSHANDDGVITRSEQRAIDHARTQQLHMRHRGAMGYTPVRTAVWAKDGFKDHVRNFGQTILGRKRSQHIESEI